MYYSFPPPPPPPAHQLQEKNKINIPVPPPPVSTLYRRSHVNSSTGLDSWTDLGGPAPLFSSPLPRSRAALPPSPRAESNRSPPSDSWRFRGKATSSANRLIARSVGRSVGLSSTSIRLPSGVYINTLPQNWVLQARYRGAADTNGGSTVRRETNSTTVSPSVRCVPVGSDEPTTTTSVRPNFSSGLCLRAEARRWGIFFLLLGSRRTSRKTKHGMFFFPNIGVRATFDTYAPQKVVVEGTRP